MGVGRCGELFQEVVRYWEGWFFVAAISHLHDTGILHFGHSCRLALASVCISHIFVSLVFGVPRKVAFTLVSLSDSGGAGLLG